MPQGHYLPEGWLLHTPQNRFCMESTETLQQAWQNGICLESIVTMCDEERNLYVRLGKYRGKIPKGETALGAESGKVREIAILSRVGKPVCFQIIGREGEDWILSRRVVQQEAQQYYMKNLQPGEVIRAKVTHLEQFGAFVDIGCGLVSMISIENISVSRIRHPQERFAPRQDIYAVVLKTDPQTGRINLSHRELLGTWKENADRLTQGSAVRGIIRSVEQYGVFVELAPNLSGLAEYEGGLSSGMEVAVYIKSILEDRMKIKLTILDKDENTSVKLISDEDYFIRSGRLKRWQYQPDICTNHCIETDFS